MSEPLNRRGILSLFGGASLAAVAGGQPSSVLGRGRMRFLSVHGVDRASATLRHAAAQIRDAGIPGIGAAIERAHPLDVEIPAEHAELVARLGGDPTAAAKQMAAEARAIAALAVIFPPEIAAYRSFAPHLQRRLYAELLTREAHRAAPAGPPPRPRSGT